jgi:hypothetical protein
MTVSGNRYGRGLVRPGGVGFDIPDSMGGDRASSRTLRGELHPGRGAVLRFDIGAVVSRRSASSAIRRASPTVRRSRGEQRVARDVRHDHPYGVFRFAQIPMATAWAGDVLARSFVGWKSCARSTSLSSRHALFPRGVRSPCGALAPDGLSLRSRRIARRGRSCPPHRQRGQRASTQGHRSIVPQLAGCRARGRGNQSRFSPVQQEFQSVICRSISNRTTLVFEYLRTWWAQRARHPRSPRMSISERFRGRPSVRSGLPV